MKLKYEDYVAYYASKCELCKGQKRVKHDGIWTTCLCQHTAALKWRFEQFEISPSNLKYKTWNDFDGIVDDGTLTKESFVSAKKKALGYCFSSSNLSVLNNRSKYLIVHKHREDGQNVIVTGKKNSGKTLIAALIVKEIAYACRIFKLNISYKYIKNSFLQDAARWDNMKPVDHPFLDELSEVDFLVIDHIDLPPGGHTTPPDHISMDVLFDIRSFHHRPTICICSDIFWSCVKNPKYSEQIRSQWGREFFGLLQSPDNLIIELQKIK